MKLGGKIDKDVIIRTVAQLESYAELKLHSARSLPGMIITMTLGLPAEPAEQTVNALFVNPPKPVDMRPPSAGRSRTPNTAARPRPPSNGARPQATAPRGPSADRERSKSPRRGQQPVARGRSTEKKSSSYSAEIELDPALECLQFYSRYSTSPNEVRKQSVPGIFRRPLTPKSKQHMKKTYFFATSGDTRFKDVR